MWTVLKMLMGAIFSVKYGFSLSNYYNLAILGIVCSQKCFNLHEKKNHYREVSVPPHFTHTFAFFFFHLC